jgi:ABC-type polysaccharide/polyol phosphate export permease
VNQPYGLGLSSLVGRRARLAAEDLKGLVTQPIWWYLAWQDIRQRYRRSLIGP